MMGIVRSIKNIALDLRNTTSKNDDRYEKLQDIVGLCDDLTDRFADDGR